MTTINFKSTVLGIGVESSEGTPVVPALATDFTAIQEDMAIVPAFEVLENMELKNSLGKSKSIMGMENPTASFSHYLRHSGVEGQAPDFNEVLKALFGSEVVASTEYDTVSSSTITTVKVNTGEGANFQRGQLLLVKDATNGYAIRPVHSVATDDLTLGFDLSNAPASGVNLGKCVLYKPTTTGHQTLSIWEYLGSNGLINMMSGSRVTEASVNFEAGQLINMSFSLEGVKYYYNPIVITASTKYLDFVDDDGDHNAVVAAKTYSDPHELADAIATAMNDLTSETITCTYSDTTGKYTIATSTSTVFSLEWATGTNTANTIGTKLGFVVSADDTSATTYTSDSAISLAPAATPSYDAADPITAKNNTVFLGDHDDNVCFHPSSVGVTISTPKRNINDICAETGKSGSIIQSREVTITVKSLLAQYDADMFRRFRSNADTRFFYAFGNKSGGNWVAGQCGGIYAPTNSVTSFNVTNDDGLVSLELELKAYVDSSNNGEIYLGLV